MNESRDKQLLFSMLSADIPVGFCPVVIGKICSAYGILGWLKIISYTERFDNVINYQPWFVKLFTRWLRIIVENWKNCQKNFFFIVKIRGINDRDTALLLRNCEIFIDILQFPLLNCGEYYWKDIIGCQVIGISGYQFGKVVDLMETGSNDVLIIRDKKCGIVDQNYLVPFIMNEVIKDVNIIDRVICIDWDMQFQ